MRRRLAYLLILVGIAVLATVPLGVLRSDWRAGQAQAVLASQFKTARACRSTFVPDPACAPSTEGRRAAAATHSSEKSASDVVVTKLPPLAAQPIPGGVLDKLVIPAIGLSRYVVQGTAENDLAQGPGHYLGTPLPGKFGNVAIAGHRTTYGAPFWDLNELTRGDRVLLTGTTGRTWTYVVIGHVVVPPSDTSVIDPLEGYYLTLTTCNPRFWATSRLVVRAELNRT
jgi:sortase A